MPGIFTANVSCLNCMSYKFVLETVPIDHVHLSWQFRINVLYIYVCILLSGLIYKEMLKDV